MSERDSTPEWIPSDKEARLNSMGYTSTGISPRSVERKTLLEAIEADPHRRPFEKESNILWNAGSNVAQIYTTEPALMRRFVCHDHFRFRNMTVVTDESSKSGVQMDAEELRERTTETNGGPTIGSVYSVSGIAPLGLITVATQPRTSTGHANIVSGRVLENDPRKGDGGEFP